MNTKKIALVEGDGSGPEMMAQATRIAAAAAGLDKLTLEFIKTPMGWNAYHEFGDTLPKASLEKAIELGVIFFGGVGDFKNDTTIGVEQPEMRPEARALLPIRKKWGFCLISAP